MSVGSSYRVNFNTPRNVFMLNAQMRDYARVGIELFGRRVMIYSAALSLEAVYYSWMLAALSLVVVVFSESFDRYTFIKVFSLEARDIVATRFVLLLLQIGAVVSALNIAGFAVSIALLQGHTTHFMSLFFLLAAAIFAAINTNQILSILNIRLCVYLIAFIFIPLYDIISVRPPYSSELWVQLFACVFVIFFISDCSRITRSLYLRTLEQMLDLKREHEKTKAAYVAKSNFLSTVSHELRTPLTSIKGSLDLITHGAYGDFPDRMSEPIKIAQRNSQRLASLIDDLLDLQKIEANRMRYDFVSVELSELLEEAIVANEPFATQFNVSLTLHEMPDLTYVKADIGRLQQVFSNILSNAAKFSSSGGTVLIDMQKFGDLVRISFVDQGIGLDERKRKEVFDEFSQLDASDRRKFGGTGLGMNISKRIVEAHGGTLDYFKNSGAGTTFYVDLPVIASDALESSLKKTSIAC